MKIILSENNNCSTSGETIHWRFLPDSAYCNAGKPFFLPDFAEEFEAFLTPVVKISRLGKSVAGKFAGRYYSEVAPAIHFRSSALMKKLRAEGMPDDMGCSFDRSLIVGEFMPLVAPGEESGFSLLHNGECVYSISQEEIASGANRAIEASSQYNSLKMGDLILGLPSSGVTLKIGDRLEVISGRETVLKVAVK